MPLSYSQLSLYRRCPKQYEYAAIQKIPRSVSQAESFGLSLHNTLRRFGELEMEKTEGKPIRKQLQLFTDDDKSHHASLALDQTTLSVLWRQCFISQGYGSRAEMDARFKEGERALERFFAWWKNEPRTVIAIEAAFKLQLPEANNAVLAGRFDRIERTKEGLVIIDFKSGKPRPQESVDSDLQLSVYAMAASEQYGEPIAALVLLSVTEDGCIEQKTTRNSSQLKDARAQIKLLAGRIEERDFAATPSKEKCAYCPYKDICPARMR